MFYVFKYQIFTSVRVFFVERNVTKNVSRTLINLDTFSIQFHYIENTRFDVNNKLKLY